ncbi:MAG: encapsulin-associated ferritin-like protein [Rhodospirillaceae bacterium]
MAQSAGFHESIEALKVETMDRHRAIVSIMEEMDAIDWYDQRVDASRDDELRAILAHNRDEEKEHAAMLLEWLRRRDPVLDRMLRQYLFIETPILEREAEADATEAASGEEMPSQARGDGSLGIGSMRGK